MITAALLAGGPAGGSAPYHADAVLFDPGSDPDCRLEATGIISADTPVVSWAGWTFIPDPSFSNGAPTFCNDVGINAVEVPGVLWNNPGDAYVHAKAFGGASEFVSVEAGTSVPSGTWVWLAGNMDTGHAPGSRTTQYFIGDTPIVLSPDNGGRDTGIAFDIPFGSMDSVPASIRSNGEPIAYSEVFVWPGQLIDWSVQATRRLLYSAAGKPVDPAAALVALGMPAMAFSGDATGFIVNQGTGGAFGLILGTVTNASSSPSD